MNPTRYDPRFFASSIPARLWLLCVFSVALLVVYPAHGLAADSPTPELENALLSEDWPAIIALLQDVTPQTPSPVLRLIKGHACLAENRNNESVVLFHSLAAPRDLSACYDWAKTFLEHHSDKGVCFFLLGDTEARNRRWQGAATAFGTALEKGSPKLRPLVLNARGVAHAAAGGVERAMADLEAARAANPRLADAHANLGFLAIQENEGAPGAFKDFEAALAVSPQFALALYGKACIETVLGKWDQAEEDLASARTDPAVGPIINTRVAQTADAISGGRERLLLARADDREVQMGLDSALNRVRTEGAGHIGGGLNDVVNKLGESGWDPAMMQHASDSLMQTAKTSPAKAQDLARQLGNIDRTTGFWGRAAEPFTRSNVRVTEQTEVTTGVNGRIKPEIGIGPVTGSVGEIGGHTDLTRRRTEEFTPGRGFPNQFFDNTINKGAFARDMLNDLRNNGLSSPDRPQGFDTSPQEAAWDEGNWPFSAVYAIGYTAEVPPDFGQAVEGSSDAAGNHSN